MQPRVANVTVSGRLRARAGMLIMTGVCLLGAIPASADGGVGTGNGLGGGVVALIVGLIGMALGGLALARSRRPPHR
jgi:hypothetical protein